MDKEKVRNLCGYNKEIADKKGLPSIRLKPGEIYDQIARMEDVGYEYVGVSKRRAIRRTLGSAFIINSLIEPIHEKPFMRIDYFTDDILIIHITPDEAYIVNEDLEHLYYHKLLSANIVEENGEKFLRACIRQHVTQGRIDLVMVKFNKSLKEIYGKFLHYDPNL